MKKHLILCLLFALFTGELAAQELITNVYGRSVRSLNGKWNAIVDLYDQGHRMEIYVNEELAADIIAFSKSFNIDAQIVGRCYDNDEGEGNKLTILSEFGKFIY